MTDLTPRQHWISVLSHSAFDELASRWHSLDLQPDFRLIRPAEIGLLQLQGRMGASGNPFNIGDGTFTRAVVQLAEGPLGYGYVLGRQREQAELAALLDALLQTRLHASLMEVVIAPLAALHRQRQGERTRQVATSKVDFFTLRSE